MWFVTFSALSVITAALALILSWRAVRNAGPGSVSQARSVRLLTSRIEQCEESFENLTTEVQRIANRQKMQRVRAANLHAIPDGDAPDPYKEPDRWRAYMNSTKPGAKQRGT